MQLKYGFKKEWAQFLRTFRLWGVIIAVFALALGNPLMFKFVGIVLGTLEDNSQLTNFAAVASVSGQASPGAGDTGDVGGLGDDLLGGMGFADMASMYSDAGLMYSSTLANICSSSMLIVMLILMSPAGGEQKKRAMIVPLCCKLEYKNYLIPKFVIYPLTVLAATFVSSLVAGEMCAAMFPDNKPDAFMIPLAALCCAVYCTFLTSVYLALGLCTSHPGFMTAAVYVGQVVLQPFVNGMGLSGYNPITLLNMCSGVMFTGEFDLSANIASIAVAIVLSLIICVLMYFMTLGILKAKKVDNQAEDEPQF